MNVRLSLSLQKNKSSQYGIGLLGAVRNIGLGPGLNAAVPGE